MDILCNILFELEHRRNHAQGQVADESSSFQAGDSVLEVEQRRRIMNSERVKLLKSITVRKIEAWLENELIKRVNQEQYTGSLIEHMADEVARRVVG